MKRNKLLHSYLISLILGLTVGCSQHKKANGIPDLPSSPVVPVQHAQGGVDGGGGNYVGSEPDQIKAIFQGDNGFELKKTVKQVFKILEFQVRNKFVDPEDESIFSRMLGADFSGDTFDIFHDIEKSKYNLKLEGQCQESIPGGFKDASTTMNKKRSSICFSLDSLKRLPIQAVPFQLIALAVHEHAHHYGFSEDDAISAQKRVLLTLNFGLLNSTYMKTISAAASVRDDSESILKVLDSDFSDKLICKHLSSIDNSAEELVNYSITIESQFEIRLLITALDYQFGLSKESLEGADELKKTTRGLLTFCGDDPLTDLFWAEKVNEGDRGNLKLALQKVRAQAHKLVHQATGFSKQRKRK